MQRLGVIVTPGFQVMSFAALSVFDYANVVKPSFYDVHILSGTGGLVHGSLGMSVKTERLGAAEYDTVIVCSSGARVNGAIDLTSSSPGLVAFLQNAVKISRRVASIGAGVFFLAAAGILDGRHATTHWLNAGELQLRFPNVKVEKDRIFTVDGPIWTSAGASAGTDLALEMVEEDLGVEMARLIAKGLVLYHRRAGSHSQQSVLLELEPRSERMQKVLTYVKRNLHTPLSVEQLAKVAHLSLRQFTRAFTRETGRSPGKAIEDMRIEAARMMLERGHHCIDVVANETGFSGYEHMRRAFLRAFGQSPQAVRRNARSVPSPSDRLRRHVPSSFPIEWGQTERYNSSFRKRLATSVTEPCSNSMVKSRLQVTRVQ